MKTIKTKTVTRTITANKCTCIYADMNENKVIEKVTFINGSYTDSELDYLLRTMPTEANIIFVKLVSVEKSDILYGISEADFIKYGKVLPARNKAERDN